MSDTDDLKLAYEAATEARRVREEKATKEAAQAAADRTALQGQIIDKMVSLDFTALQQLQSFFDNPTITSTSSDDDNTFQKEIDRLQSLVDAQQAELRNKDKTIGDVRKDNTRIRLENAQLKDRPGSPTTCDHDDEKINSELAAAQAEVNELRNKSSVIDPDFAIVFDTKKKRKVARKILDLFTEDHIEDGFVPPNVVQQWLDDMNGKRAADLDRLRKEAADVSLPGDSTAQPSSDDSKAAQPDHPKTSLKDRLKRLTH